MKYEKPCTLIATMIAVVALVPNAVADHPYDKDTDSDCVEVDIYINIGDERNAPVPVLCGTSEAVAQFPTPSTWRADGSASTVSTLRLATLVSVTSHWGPQADSSSTGIASWALDDSGNAVPGQVLTVTVTSTHCTGATAQDHGVGAMCFGTSAEATTVNI